MPTLTIYNTRVTAQSTTGYASHQEYGDPQIIACVSVADATTKLQTALGSTPGAAQAATHATAFSTRQTAYLAPSKHVMNFGASIGATAKYTP
jgi:hypothetical protein